MKRIFSFTVFFATAISAMAFEGEITVQFKGNPLLKEDYSYTWHFSAQKYRLDVLYTGEEANGKSAVYLPDGTNKVIVYNTNPTTEWDYKYFSLVVDKVPEVEEYTIDTTEETKTIDSFVCTKYIFTSKTGRTTETWVAKEIAINWNGFVAPFRALPELRILAKYNISGFPLETIMKDNEKIIAVSTLVSIKQEPQEISLFSIPEGYSEWSQQTTK